MEPTPPAREPTTVHLARACSGDEASLSAVVESFTPFVRAEAEYWVRGKLRRFLEPEDLVQQVWVGALASLRRIQPRGGRRTPVLMSFLSTYLRNTVRNLLRKHAPGKPGGAQSVSDRIGETLPASSTAVIERVLRSERASALQQALESLPPAERELVVLRGIEGYSYEDIAKRVGGSADSLRVTYHRILRKLEQLMPEDLRDELSAD